MTTAHALRRSRLATVGLFFLLGFSMAVWVANIPVIRERTGVSVGVLGTLLLFTGVGQVTGMQLAGGLSDRIGSRRVAGVAAGVLAVAVNLPGLATSAVGLGAALAAFGLGYGLMNVAANDQAVLVERAYGRPIMASFHAFFSIGGAAGAGLAAALAWAGVPLHWPLAVGAAAAVVLGSLCIPHLRPAAADDVGGTAAADGDPTDAPRQGRSGPARRRAAVLAGMAFLLMLAEGTANDWSALHATHHLGEEGSRAALAFAVFSVAMTVGRLRVDALVARFGPVAIVRYGSALASAGLLLVIMSAGYPLTLSGWLLFGIGLSGIVPQIFSAAGNLDPRRRGAVMARVAGAGYLGLLAGPALIGWIAERIGVNAALVLPLVFCAVGVILAGTVAPREARGTGREARQEGPAARSVRR